MASVVGHHGQLDELEVSPTHSSVTAAGSDLMTQSDQN
jgi:hypothetical protein